MERQRDAMAGRRGSGLSRSFYLQVGLAANPSAPAPLLHLLALGDSVEVKSVLAGNPALGSGDASLLFAALDGPGRARLARNPACPVEVLVRLPELGDPEISADAVRHPNLFPVLLERIWAGAADADELSAAAGNPALPDRLMAAAAADPRLEVRCQLAKNPSLPIPIARSLSADASKHVRRVLARNPELSGELTGVLIRDEDDRVRLELLKRGDLDRVLSDRIALSILSEYPDEVAGVRTVSSRILMAVQERLSSVGWENLAANPSVPPSLLDAVFGTMGRRVDLRIR